MIRVGTGSVVKGWERDGTWFEGGGLARLFVRGLRCWVNEMSFCDVE